MWHSWIEFQKEAHAASDHEDCSMISSCYRSSRRIFQSFSDLYSRHIGHYKQKCRDERKHAYSSSLRCPFVSKQPPTSEQSSVAKNVDPYDRYRQGLNTEILKELQEESRRTVESIDQQLYQQVYQEIQDASSRKIEAEAAIAEYGPTGQYLYDWIEAAPGNRLYRRRSVQDSREELVLPLTYKQLDLQAMSLSIDESLLAYLVTKLDTGESQVWVRHIETGRQIKVDTGMAELVVGVELGPRRQSDGAHSLYWTTTDEQGRPSTVHACRIDPVSLTCSESITIYQSNDPTVHVHLQRSKGCEHIILNAQTQTSNQVFLMQSIDRDLVLVKERQDDCMYHVDVGTDGTVFVLIQGENQGRELELWQTSVDGLPVEGAECRVQKVPPKTGYAITEMEIFHDCIALCERSTLDGRQRIRIVDRWTGGDEWIVPLPEDQAAVSVVSLAGNMNYFAESIRFHVESPVLCRTTYEYDVRSRRVRQLSGETPSGEYMQERPLVNSRDGTLVPLSIVYRKDLVERMKCEAIPVILIGYGAYGQSIDLSFNPSHQPLLNRGFVFAYAHTRGGGELGSSWHRRGRRYEKIRGIEDYLACAEALKGYLLDRSVRLTAKAFSAGGVLVGAATVQRPEIFHSVVLTNAFLDVYETMMNDELHLTKHEWEEYGNVRADERAATSMASYCPVKNVPSIKRIPAFLVIGTLDDQQVPFFNAVIFGKKLRGSTEKSEVSLYVESRGGHHLGPSRMHVASLEATFIIKNR